MTFLSVPATARYACLSDLHTAYRIQVRCKAFIIPLLKRISRWTQQCASGCNIQPHESRGQERRMLSDVSMLPLQQRLCAGISTTHAWEAKMTDGCKVQQHSGE